MTTSMQKAAKDKAAVEVLRAKGAELLKAEDRWGETKTGWWMDGVWLAPKNAPRDAIRVIEGN